MINFTLVLLVCFFFPPIIDICHQILDLYSQGKQPIPQQIQEKEKIMPTLQQLQALAQAQGQNSGQSQLGQQAKKASPQSSPPKQLKRPHVSFKLKYMKACFF